MYSYLRESGIVLKTADYCMRIKYTALVIPMGYFEYCYMPFGLKNARAVFHQYINRVLRGFIDTGNIVMHLDVVSSAAGTFEKHLEILADVLRVLRLNVLSLDLDLK